VPNNVKEAVLKLEAELGDLEKAVAARDAAKEDASDL